MELALICRDALADSCIANLYLAIQEKKRGKDVAVIFTGEALIAAVEGVFRWSDQLSPQAVRLRLASNAVKLDIPVMGSGVARNLDTKAVIRRAREVGVALYASSIWVELLGYEGKLPEGITKLNIEKISEAKTVIGSF